ncbi:MAG: hypothetical protein ACR2MT_15715, partial [Aurantibacter sp.]
AIDGQLKMDVKDTIYSVKGYPLGNRIWFLHDPSQDVSGFHVYVSGSTFYYHVPEDMEEGQSVPQEENDTIAVLVLDLDLPNDHEVDYPFTTEVVIQPLDESGMPLDEFDRSITIEDPNDNDPGSRCATITQPFQVPSAPRWRWDFTIRERNGVIENSWEPARRRKINRLGWGCCVNGDISATAAESIFCREGTTQPGYEWVELEVDDYIVRYEEYMWVFDNGVFNVQGIEDKKQYFPSLTNFCDREIGYEFYYQVYGAPNDTPVGTHDFTPGAKRLNLDLPNWEGPYRMPRSAEITYTCHTLFLIWEDGEGFDSFVSRYEDTTTALPEYHD